MTRVAVPGLDQTKRPAFHEAEGVRHEGMLGRFASFVHSARERPGGGQLPLPDPCTFAMYAAAWARRSRLSFDRIELT
jgi:hypothetical protein